MSSSPGFNTMQLHHFFEQSVDNYPSNIALICDNVFISYQELENRANQLAHFLSENQISKGSIVGILLERSVESYVAILATLKAGAAYVPIEADYPDERINYIFSDLPFNAVLTSSMQLEQKNLSWPTAYALDLLAEEISKRPAHRVIFQENLSAADLCYIIYTSGSTGKPKGVEITQRSICHYVDAASKLYEISSNDKVYQGFSLAFDASLEELWMAFANGASLIACTSKEVRSGLGLISFLQQHRVSVFSTVPTLLSSLEGQLPDLRLLILGGESCPPTLVKRWSREGLRILNTYGPTEATIIATYAECHPEKEITIGKPLPGYEVLVVNEQLQEVSEGEEGELCIGGIALARGYVNRPEHTAEKFVLNPADNSQRLYRTGDLVSKDAQGNLRFAGRVDDQIKLRGFRIELNEIETVIMHYAGIKQAVAALQILEQPTLVAYLILDKNSGFDVNELKVFLRSRLPDYMVPALIEVLESFPVLASGKVNRKELPKPVQKIETTFKAPESELAQKIAHAWEHVFDCKNISITANFFYDLGGHSLHAARVISNLRQIPALKNISILDLYKNPTIIQLEEKFSDSDDNLQVSENSPRQKYKPPQWKYYLCGIGQFFGCLLQYAVGTLQLLAVVLCYSWVSSEYSIISRESQLAFLALFLSMPIISLFITISLKWILLGRVKPGEYPLWGWFYFRWWLVQRLLKNLFLAKFLVGSPLAPIYYRLLGAKIGKNCFLGSMQVSAHDLLTVGDNTSIGADARLNGYIVEDGWLKIGTINIGDNCYIGARAVVGLNTQIEDKGILDEMSMLPDQGLIPQGTYFAGSPALPGPVPADHITRKKIAIEESTMLENTLFGILHYLGIVFVMMVYYLCLIPSISLISYYYDQSHYLTTMFFAIPLGAILFLGLYYLCIVFCKKIILDKIKPGEYPIKSFYYFRHWILVKLLDGDEISVMADTLFLPLFLRLLGAKLGKGVEMGETPHIIPDLVTIEEGGFTASSVALAWPGVCNGFISFAPVTIGRRAFVGNVSLLSGGKSIGEGTLLGCLSVTPPGDKAKEPFSAWLGSPAVFLPKRELFVGYSDKETFYPSKKLYFTRLVIEFIRIILPSTFSLIALFNLLYVLDYMLSEYSWGITALVLPPAEMFFTVCLVGVLAALKWLMLGKLKPLTKPIWDPFIWKNDVIEYSYNYYTNPHLTNKVLGTPFALWIHRCLGTKAGKRVFTDSAEFSEFDLITIGNDVCINAETIIQTHLYEDRIFKVSNVTIGSGCNVGVGSIVLYNTLMEENSSLGSLSLLMKGERLPANTHWAGIPAQSTALGALYPQVADQTAAAKEAPEEAIPELL
ncbi:amino acid adenylation domain-containing protein [Fluoribacter dumoffii]|uniref:Linear gramicidin synthase subunit D n=1 Tax=Fluoribacter dumoffii TaxID=463 RepID=A0A377G635_9GAMM|nr:Pls/PosA family non-ribosomal peptide synthetase [Fluoribacter dumoffii]KTC92501.1 peptide synthetase, non-ribosomal [Fluoribacter dumoffii NY 23]MCW8387077.1 amino acid adenylation domain-containing protein [Fluoribacter dumoffii]MCW8497280.1 amino acid adenylation domain-containing protein [Fluoribacter dumoffii]STO20267.1 Linear gramicidin synthase subunit D [Fluoribacter dumoffii]